MTENEIMKALECCIDEDNEFITCDGCVFMECKMGKERECTYYMLKSVLDLINRKNAEIDRLTAIEESHREQNGELRKEVEALQVANEHLAVFLEEAKAEAIKEFAEKIYRSCAMYGQKDKFNKTVFLNIVNQIADEMGVEL